MRHVWSALCTRAIVDRDTGMVSLIDLCDVIEVSARELDSADSQVAASDKKIHHLGPVSLYFMTMWYRTTEAKREEGEFRVFVDTPKGKRIRQNPRSVVFEDNKASHAGIKFGAFPYAGRGTYQVGVESRKTPSSRWTTMAKHPLEIRAREEATQASPGPDDSPVEQTRKKKAASGKRRAK